MAEESAKKGLKRSSLRFEFEFSLKSKANKTSEVKRIILKSQKERKREWEGLKRRLFEWRNRPVIERQHLVTQCCIEHDFYI